MSTIKISQLPQVLPTTNTANTIVIGVNKQTSVTSTYSLDDIFNVSDAYAQAAFLKANTPSSVANSAGNFANGAFLAANSGAIFANASFITANASYTSQNTTATFANAAFTRANSGYGQANSAASFANGAFVTSNASYDKANSNSLFANAAFITANSGASFANGAFVTANSGAVFANAAFTKANNALANTTGTFDGDLIITGYVQPQKGFVYTPKVYASAQTAITIDMANNSMVRAQTASGLVVTLSDLLAGKEVVAWITNTAASNQTFTHGVSAINSTSNTTTYSIPATSTILARYMSVDGTTQNTFVAITRT